MPKTSKARAVGLNHIALEVGDIEEALAFYGRLSEFKLRGKSEQRPWCRSIAARPSSFKLSRRSPRKS